MDWKTKVLVFGALLLAFGFGIIEDPDVVPTATEPTKTEAVTTTGINTGPDPGNVRDPMPRRVQPSSPLPASSEDAGVIIDDAGPF